MQFDLEHSDMVEKLVVVDIAPGAAPDNHTAIYEALLALDLSKITARQQAEDFLKKHIADTGTLQFLLKNISRTKDGRYAWKMNLPVLWDAYPDIMARVQGPPFDKPTLFIRGSESGYVRDVDFPEIKALFPQAELVTIDGAGHWVHADKPAELLAVVRGFLG